MVSSWLFVGPKQDKKKRDWHKSRVGAVRFVAANGAQVADGGFLELSSRDEQEVKMEWSDVRVNVSTAHYIFVSFFSFLFVALLSHFSKFPSH